MDDLTDATGAGDGAGAQSKLSLALGLVGVVGLLLGAVGLFMANNARQTAARLEAEMVRADQLSALDTKLVDLENRLMNVGAEVANLKRSDNLVQQMPKALDQLAREVRANREQIIDITEQLKKVGEAAARVPAASPAAGSAGAASSSTPPQDGVHVIASGDTFGKLARKYGVTVEAIQAANPGVDPTKLQIGQKIKIP